MDLDKKIYMQDDNAPVGGDVPAEGEEKVDADPVEGGTEGGDSQ